MKTIGIGIIGTGYMGKAHSVAMNAVGAVFDTSLKPVCEMICATTKSGAQQKAQNFGFNRSTDDWRVLVDDPKVEAIVIASPQNTHKENALATFELGKPVLCEKPMGASTDDAQAMADAAEKSGVINMVGFNYVRTPATQFARQLIADGAIGNITWFRGEHTEDFYADKQEPATWRTQGRANGTMGDLSSHMINAALALLGPISKVSADIETVHHERPINPATQSDASKSNQSNGMEKVTNDDHAHCLCRFSSGVMGHLYFSRISSGRKMGYAYEISGTEGAIRFDQEDHNALWLYQMSDAEAIRGFRKVLTGPAHPDYKPFCLGPGHGTGYQDQLIIEAKDFLQAIHEGKHTFPTFKDGLAVNHVIDAMWHSNDSERWVDVTQVG